MFGVGHLPEIAIMLVVALIVFGPKKLPEIGSSLGRGIREFKDATSGLHEHRMPEIAQPVPVPVARLHSAEAQTVGDSR